MPDSTRTPSFQIVTIGASLGGFAALKAVLAPLPCSFPVPIVVVCHQASDSGHYIVDALDDLCLLDVRHAEHNRIPKAGTVYLATPDQHVIISETGRMSLVDGPKVKFSRPAIDPLFESAARHYKAGTLAVVLTGANDDGTDGAKTVIANGGTVVVQDPESAAAPTMPQSALSATHTEHVVWLSQIGPHIWTVCR